MKSMTGWLALALLGSMTAQAADKPSTMVIRDYTDMVAPADQQAYETGVKNFNQCLHQHGFKYTWTAWTHETGDTYSYSYTSDPVSWGSFDEMDSAGKACEAVIRSEVNPHLKSETSAFMKPMSDLSHMAKDMDKMAPAFIEVVYFTLKPGHEAQDAFEATVKKIADAANKSNWQAHFQVGKLMYAGEGAPDYILVSPDKSWAEVGEEANPPLWKMIESVYGKSDAATMRKTLNDVIKDESAHVDSYNAELTYTASGK